MPLKFSDCAESPAKKKRAMSRSRKTMNRTSSGGLPAAGEGREDAMWSFVALELLLVAKVE